MRGLASTIRNSLSSSLISSCTREGYLWSATEQQADNVPDPAPAPVSQSQPGDEDEKPQVKKDRRSRPKRWTDACVKAREAIEELIDLQSEYQDWFDGLPDSHKKLATAEKVNVITDLNLEFALSVIDEAGCVDLPKALVGD
jgi:hypothetical protein